jgi:hypothetical protein
VNDWRAWFQDYDDPTSSLSERLACVQRHVRARLDDGPARLVSACAGDGRDVLDVLRPDDVVTGRLVELDPVLAATARAVAPGGLDVVTGDAGVTDAYAGVVPADLVLLCGIFGNITDEDVAGTVAAAPMLCAPGAHVIWTRGRNGVGAGPTEPGVDPAGDLTPAIRGWFAGAGFTELSFDAPAERSWSVGVHRYDGSPVSFQPGRRLFAFVR